VEIIRTRKKDALPRRSLACQGEIRTLDVTRGCGGQCVFCHARAYAGAPAPGELLLHDDLPAQLKSTITSPRRRSPLPRWVLLNSQSDCFLGGPEVVEVARKSIEVLVTHRIGISVSTRGMIPDDVIEMLGKHARHTRVFVPVPTMDDAYTRAWEPGAALPQQRMLLVRRLMEAGLHPRIRLDPVIPFVNDTTAMLRATFSAVVGMGLTSVTVSFMHLRPGVAEQVQAEGPPEQTGLMLGSFTAPDQGGRYRRLSLKRVRSSFKKVKTLASEYDVAVSACSCQTPGLEASSCAILPPELPVPVGLQEQLSFDDDPA